MRRLAAVLLVLLAGSVLGQPIEIAADTELSDTGYYRLSWSPPGSEAVTVQESTTTDFSDADTIYHGTDAATVVSGRLDGIYHYRIRAGQGRWSESITVTVRHHSLTLALAFLAVGAVVFFATAALIVSGHRRHRLEMAAAGGEDAS